MRANENVRLSDSDEFPSTSMKPVSALAGYEDLKVFDLESLTPVKIRSPSAPDLVAS